MLFVVGHSKPLFHRISIELNTFSDFPFRLVGFNNGELAIIMQASSSTLLYVSACCILLILNISYDNMKLKLENKGKCHRNIFTKRMAKTSIWSYVKLLILPLKVVYIH